MRPAVILAFSTLALSLGACAAQPADDEAAAAGEDAYTTDLKQVGVFRRSPGGGYAEWSYGPVSTRVSLRGSKVATLVDGKRYRFVFQPTSDRTSDGLPVYDLHDANAIRNLIGTTGKDVFGSYLSSVNGKKWRMSGDAAKNFEDLKRRLTDQDLSKTNFTIVGAELSPNLLGSRIEMLSFEPVKTIDCRMKGRPEVQLGLFPIQPDASKLEGSVVVQGPEPMPVASGTCTRVVGSMLYGCTFSQPNNSYASASFTDSAVHDEAHPITISLNRTDAAHTVLEFGCILPSQSTLQRLSDDGG